MNLNKFTTKSQQALQEAQALAFEYHNNQVDTIHLLYSLLTQHDSLIVAILKKLDIDYKKLTEEVEDYLKNLPKTSTQTQNTYITPQLNYAIFQAEKIAKRLGDEFISTEHLFLSLIETESQAQDLLNFYNITTDSVMRVLAQVRGSQKVDSLEPETKYQALEKYAVNLTKLAREEKLDPVIGRDEEIRRLLQVLSRRTKNNPVLIGEPGTGKTAIVEGLAQRIISGDVPENLLNKEILSIDIGSMIAGSKFRGEFEDRLKAVLKEIKNSKDRYIIFIDEIHTIVGAGATEGAMDASNMLKPALARGELRCIGATTIKEYQKYIEKDQALERRFQPILVHEPSVEDTIAILRGIKEKYEIHHGVRITDDALIAAAKLSDRYITDRFLPDKAIDLIDEATAALRIELNSMPTELDQAKRQLLKLEIEKKALEKEKTEHAINRLEEIKRQISEIREQSNKLEIQWKSQKEIINQIQTLKKEIDKLKQQSDILERESEFERVAEIRYGLIPSKEKEIQKLKNKLRDLQTGQNGKTILKEEVTEEDIAAVVSKWTNIPLSKMLRSDLEKLVNAESELGKRVIGQEKAIKAVANALRRSRAGLSDENRPIGSFIFLGPTGVGKTELAKALAEFMFNSENNIIRVDMSEYMEKHAVSKLIGSPPGYVGYDEGGQLTEKVRKQPYSVILFDEIEKAHPEVFNILLQLLDDGRLTDAKGRTVNFKNTIIIMTSNIGSDLITKAQNQTSLGFAADKEKKKDVTDEKLKQALQERFRPEFLNRIDEIIIFNMLTQKQIRQIVDLQLEKVIKRLENKEIKITFTEALKDQLAKEGYDPVFGARPLKRLIQTKILDELALQIIDGKIKSSVTVDCQRNKIIFKTP